MTGMRKNADFTSAWVVLLWVALCASEVHAGEGFVLVATEDNTRDMSVNLGTDALYGEVHFADRLIDAPATVAGRDRVSEVLNHDDGVLDVQHTLFKKAALSSRTLIHFETLKDELRDHCWRKEDAKALKATLRLYVIPPYGPSTHHRLWGIAPTVHTPDNVALDPPPASVPIGVFRQTEPWVEGPGQNSFFSTSYDEDLLLDVQRVGIATAGTWLDVDVEEVDVCLNREPGLHAESKEGDRINLCFDDAPGWQPWMEWDVSEAVRYWLEHDFDPEVDHGLSLYQYPGETAEQQTRISPPLKNLGRSRAVVSFASSSAVADCTGAGGQWGGPDGSDFIYANTLCMTPEFDDLEPGDPYGAPRFITPLTRPEWAPQLVIESLSQSEACTLGASVPELNATIDAPASGAIVLTNRSDTRLEIASVELDPADALELDGGACGSLDPGETCMVGVALDDDEPGAVAVQLVVRFRRGDGAMTIQRFAIEGQVGSDEDGVPDAVEDDAAGKDRDGNGDDVPDREQSHVASLRNVRGEAFTIAARKGDRLGAVQMPDLPVDQRVARVDFPHGFLTFELHTKKDGVVSIEVRLPNEQSSDGLTYYAFGPTEQGEEAHWYPFASDGKLGAAIDDGTLLLKVADGGLGDSDLEKDGVIRVVGGVGERPPPSDALTTDAEIGIFCTLGLPSSSSGPHAAWLLLATSGWLARRRSRRAG